MEQIDQLKLNRNTSLDQSELINDQNQTTQTCQPSQTVEEKFSTQLNKPSEVKALVTSTEKLSLNQPIILANAEFQEISSIQNSESLGEVFEEKEILVELVDEANILSNIKLVNSVNLTQTIKDVESTVQKDSDAYLSKNSGNEPVSIPKPQIKRPRLSMPQLYLRTDTLSNVKGFLPGDDLQIELIVPEKENQTKSWFKEFRSLVRDFLFAAATALLIVIFVVQPVKVEGTSMLPKLHNDERIFINKFVYQFESIKRGDVVVFWYPKNPSQSFIKRVIGVPGDEIRITNGKLFINNQFVPEPYLSPEYTSNVTPNLYKMVEDHHYFVMGDNRDASNDSRAWGLVPEKYIYGKAIFRYWPLDNIGTIAD
jgi:signal peptidase I